MIIMNPLLIKYGVTNSVGWRMYSFNTSAARRTVVGQVGGCAGPEVGLYAPIKAPSAARKCNSRLHGNSFLSLVKCCGYIVIVNAVNDLNAFELCIIIWFVPHREHIMC
jgi:hypothetical protein